MYKFSTDRAELKLCNDTSLQWCEVKTQESCAVYVDDIHKPVKKGQPLNAVLQRCVQILELVCKVVPGLVEGMYLMGKAKFLSGEWLARLYGLLGELYSSMV